MRRTLRPVVDCRGIEVWLALQGSSKNRLKLHRLRDVPSSSRSGSRLEPPPGRARRGALVRCGVSRACTGVTHRNIASCLWPPTSRPWAGCGGRVLVACASLSPVSPPVGSASLLGFSHSIAGPACQLHSGHRVPFTRHTAGSSVSLHSRLCARRPASILAIGRSSDWQPP